MMMDKVAMCCFGPNIHSVVACPSVRNKKNEKHDRRTKSICCAAVHGCAEQ